MAVEQRHSGLSDTQLEHFREEGFVVVKGLLDPHDVLEPLLEEYAIVLDRLASELYADGRIASTYADLPFGERFIQIERETNDTHAQYFDFSLPQGGITADTPIWLGPAVFDVLTCAPLLDAAESILGGEISVNPVHHVRIKSPEQVGARDEATGLNKLGATNWHQDHGVVLPEADDSDILTVWFPLTEARVEHGCLQVIPRSHHRGLLDHCLNPPGGLEVPAHVASRDSALPLPTSPGDVIFMHKQTIHGSLSNVSDRIRWSLDLRYNPTGQPTGRKLFPEFVARSRQRPETEISGADAWAQLWRQTQTALADVELNGPFHRWDLDAPVCA